MFAAPALACGPGFNTGFVGLPPQRLGMGPATNGAVERRARLEGVGVFGKTAWGIADLTPALK